MSRKSRLNLQSCAENMCGFVTVCTFIMRFFSASRKLARVHALSDSNLFSLPGCSQYLHHLTDIKEFSTSFNFPCLLRRLSHKDAANSQVRCIDSVTCLRLSSCFSEQVKRRGKKKVSCKSDAATGEVKRSEEIKLLSSRKATVQPEATLFFFLFPPSYKTGAQRTRSSGFSHSWLCCVHARSL